MNMNQILNMVIRIIMRKGINAGLNKGMNAMRGQGGGGKHNNQQRHQPTMSPEEQAEFQEFKRQKQIARKAANHEKRKQGSVERM